MEKTGSDQDQKSLRNKSERVEGWDGKVGDSRQWQWGRRWEQWVFWSNKIVGA